MQNCFLKIPKIVVRPSIPGQLFVINDHHCNASVFVINVKHVRCYTHGHGIKPLIFQAKQAGYVDRISHAKNRGYDQSPAV